MAGFLTSGSYLSNPKLRLALAAVGFGAVTLATCLIAHPRMFTGFVFADDEGYMLVALDSFLNQGALYDDVFSQYGPFYYEAWGLLFSLFGIEVTHDAGRIATLVVWVLTSLVAGIATARMVGSLLLGMATQLLVFTALGTLTGEPMHPGGLICLLLAVIFAISCGIGRGISTGPMALLGGAIAALILVKVNVGAFALAAVILVCSATYPAITSRRWVRLAIEIGFVSLPILLIASQLGEAWARQYAAHVAIAALAIVIVLRTRSPGARSDEELLWLFGGLALTAAAICLAVLGSGTSPGGLLDGVIGQPLRQADAFTIPLLAPSELIVIDLIALAIAFAYRHAARGNPSRSWLAVFYVLSIGVGLALALSAAGRSLSLEVNLSPGYRMGLLAFAWVALIPGPKQMAGFTGFARILLPPLAVLQALHAYPVAGSQIAWSVFLLIPVGALCIANGVRGLADCVSEPRERRSLAIAGSLVAVALAAFVVSSTVRVPLRDARAVYNALEPLDLPGTSARVQPSEADLYRGVTAAIQRNCRSLLMLPGMNSYYLWTEQDPPTGFNATAWPTLFDDDLQQRVVSATESIDGLCLLENAPLAAGWSGGTIPDAPLVRYMQQRFEPIASFGDYRLLKRGPGRTDSE